MKGVSKLAAFVGVWILAFVAAAAVGAALNVLPYAIGVVALALAGWLALLFVGADERAEKAKATLATTLMPGETVIAQALQHRVFAFWSRRELVAISDSRMLVLRRGRLGGFNMSDLQWKDLKDARIEQNVLESLCGSNLAFDALTEAVPTIHVDGAPEAVAAQIYARAQYEEQAWEEKRRVRGMEESRAAAGGVVVHAPPEGEPAAPSPAGNRMLDEIARAKQLLDSGVLSDAEFQAMKAKILSAG